jgi:hypothetical protein
MTQLRLLLPKIHETGCGATFRRLDLIHEGDSPLFWGKFLPARQEKLLTPDYQCFPAFRPWAGCIFPKIHAA